MKKILFVIGIMGKGGAERVIAAIANELVSRGESVGIITIYGKRQDYELDEKIELFPIDCLNRIRITRPFERIKKIRHVIKKYGPDYIISFLTDVNIHVLMATRGINVPVIVSERNDPERDPEKKWQRNLRDFMYRFASGVVFQTPDAQRYFEKKTVKSSIVIPNPITPGLPHHVYNKDSKRIITACRLNSQKNLPLMIDTISELHNENVECYLDIYGDGIQLDYVSEYIKKKKMSDVIKLKGFSKNIHDEMVNSALFLITSDYEGISNSMLEALAIGIPVVSTDCPVGGARMFIENEKTGFLVPVGDLENLKKSVKYALNNLEIAEQMGMRAKSIRDRLEVKRITQIWIDYLKTL